jgi:integrase
VCGSLALPPHWPHVTSLTQVGDELLERGCVQACAAPSWPTCVSRISSRRADVSSCAEKGNKERAVYVTNGALDALREWIRTRGMEPGPLFVRLVRRPGGEHIVTTDSLSTQSIADILARRAREGGVDTLRPRDLRRTVAGELLDAGTDIATVARLIGHSSVTTTQLYDRRPEAAVAVAAGKIRFPYRAHGAHR